MSDLQADIDFFDQLSEDENDRPFGGHLGAILAAARRVANPDWKAAIATYTRMVESDMEGADWNYEEFVQNIVDAALGIAEDTTE